MELFDNIPLIFTQVENRFIGIKSRGCYETPGLTCLRAAHMLVSLSSC